MSFGVCGLCVLPPESRLKSRERETFPLRLRRLLSLKTSFPLSRRRSAAAAAAFQTDAAAAAQLLLTHWCQLKQLEQSEAKTQKSHSLGLTLLDRFFRISGSVSNSRTTIATSWQIFSCSRHRHRLGICNRPCRILHICRSIQFKFKILIFKECYHFNPIPIWSLGKELN